MNAEISLLFIKHFRVNERKTNWTYVKTEMSLIFITTKRQQRKANQPLTFRQSKMSLIFINKNKGQREKNKLNF